MNNHNKTLLICLSVLLLTACTVAELQRDYNEAADNYNAGLAAIKRDDFDNAIYYFDMAIFDFGFAERAWHLQINSANSNPEDIRTIRLYTGRSHLFLGIAHLAKHQYSHAIKQLNTALEFNELDDNDRAFVYSTRGQAYLASGDRGKAEFDYWQGRSVASPNRHSGLDQLEKKLFR